MSPLAPIIAELREHATERRFCIDQQRRIDNATGAYVRRALGWSLDLPECERTALNREAARLVAAVEAGEHEAAPKLWPIIVAAQQSRSAFDTMRTSTEKRMVALAKQLPAHPWVEGVRGFGTLSLAVIVGEAGDLASYAGPAKLWKRMGLAVMGDVRQGGLAKGAAAEDWIAHGYSARRRSTMWVIGDCLIKTNGEGTYRAVYLARKAYEITRDPEIKPIKAHRRAQRYMEKRLLRDLWRAWRGATLLPSPMVGTPLAETHPPERAAAA